MMNYIWSGIMLISIICALITGRITELSNAILSGASSAVNLVISMTGMMCLWSGLMNIAESGGMTSLLSNAFFPIMKKLFPDYEKKSAAMHAICMNITANLLGLGNAATPMGIAAMKEMQKENPKPTTANNSMVMFVVLNTASIQLIPTFMAILRQQHGSSSPFDVMPAIWVTSISAVIIGIIATKMLQRGEKTIG